MHHRCERSEISVRKAELEQQRVQNRNLVERTAAASSARKFLTLASEIQYANWRTRILNRKKLSARLRTTLTIGWQLLRTRDVR